MSFIAYTIREHLKAKVEKARLDKANNHKIIVMFPAMPERVTIVVADVLSNYFTGDSSINITLKIANV